MDVPVEVLHLEDRTMAKYEVVAEVVKIRKSEGYIWLSHCWEGLPGGRDYTWAPLDDMHAGIPDMGQAFLLQTKTKCFDWVALR